MERILVSMDAHRGSWEAWSRAISLAKRIDARLYALLVLPRAEQRLAGGADRGAASDVRKRLELLLEKAELDGIHVDYFVSEGTYEEEVIHFVEQNKITLIVAEPPDGNARHPDRENSNFRKIRHRINCRMELVTTRKDKQLNAKEG
jgi:hypothetical protein